MVTTSRNIFLLLFLCLAHSVSFCQQNIIRFDSLATQWDEAVPLGNGMLGALIWKKNDDLRFSLDRADLWDERPMKGLHRPEFSYRWVQQQVANRTYENVQKLLDWPYDNEPGPTKIPAGSLNLNIKEFGKVQNVQLNVYDAVCTVEWSSKIKLTSFVQADASSGWFLIENIHQSIKPRLEAPKYQGAIVNNGDPVGGDDLSRLGYQQGQLSSGENSAFYQQEGWDGFRYTISVRWQKSGPSTIVGTWSISSAKKGENPKENADTRTAAALKSGYAKALAAHRKWWTNFWKSSSIQVPDSSLQRQWLMEQYKFGSAARSDAPPISLQAVWTADNGRLPPWKGDFHHDLNTQLSYWPAYSGNHLQEEQGYINHLWQNKKNYERYTRQYFGVDGLAVPGVTTLDGTEMGGWIQYSLSPTVSSWLSQHFYWHWRFTMSEKFLRDTAYPWVRDVARFLENITITDSLGFRQLPISSSPEIYDNSIKAWFHQTTNYDLALMKFNFKAAAEMARTLGDSAEAAHWTRVSASLPAFSVDARKALQFAPGFPYNESHRHFSNLIAIYPLGLIKWEDGPEAQQIIQNSIATLDSIGPANWMGYSYAWLANLKAKAKDGEGAALALRIFAKAFCSGNSFHLNGDQTNEGYSKAHYRPFTLEGNFAFAGGLQEMLLQSDAGAIEIFPAIPREWKDLGFENLRAQGAFLVSANQKNRRIQFVRVYSEKGGETTLILPDPALKPIASKGVAIRVQPDGSLRLHTSPGGFIELGPGD